MSFRPLVAALLVIGLVTQSAHVARADERAEPTVWAVSPPQEVDVRSRLAMANADIGALMNESFVPVSSKPKNILSNNATTIIIVAIIAGAVLIAVGVLAIGVGGKPRKP